MKIKTCQENITPEKSIKTKKTIMLKNNDRKAVIVVEITAKILGKAIFFTMFDFEYKALTPPIVPIAKKSQSKTPSSK